MARRPTIAAMPRRLALAAPLLLAAGTAPAQTPAETESLRLGYRTEPTSLGPHYHVEADPAIATLDDWLAYLRGTAGGLAVAAAHSLGAEASEALRDLGAAYGAAGVLRAVPALARQGRCLLPADVLAAHGLSPEAVPEEMIRAPDVPAMRAVLATLAATGRSLLDDAPHRLPRPVIAAALPAVLARRDLARLLRHHHPPPGRGIGDRLAVTLAAARLRV
jgi:phytoene synthase